MVKCDIWIYRFSTSVTSLRACTSLTSRTPLPGTWCWTVPTRRRQLTAPCSLVPHHPLVPNKFGRSRHHRASNSFSCSSCTAAAGLPTEDSSMDSRIPTLASSATKSRRQWITFCWIVHLLGRSGPLSSTAYTFRTWWYCGTTALSSGGYHAGRHCRRCCAIASTLFSSWLSGWSGKRGMQGLFMRWQLLQHSSISSFRKRSRPGAWSSTGTCGRYCRCRDHSALACHKNEKSVITISC